MSNIIGHKRQIEYFTKVLSRGALAHAYLFFGPSKVGKRTFAREIGKSLLCEKKSREIGGCGVCAACLRIQKGEHPDVIAISRTETLVSKKELRKDIPIEDIRELRRMMSLALPERAWRIILVDGAEHVSQEAANALLNILEEPPERTVFFLITSEPENVLPTIRSRAQGLYFSPVPAEEIRRALAPFGFSRVQSEEIIRAAAGLPGVLFEFAEGKERFAEEEKFRKGIAAALQKGAPAFFPISAEAAQDSEMRARAAEETVRMLRSRLISERDPAKMQGLAKILKNVIIIADTAARTNVNPRLSLDILFLEAEKGFKI